MRRSLVLATLVALVSALLGGATAGAARQPAQTEELATVQFADTKSWLGCYDHAYTYDFNLPPEYVEWDVNFKFYRAGEYVLERWTNRAAVPDAGQTQLVNSCSFERQPGPYTVEGAGHWYDADGVSHDFTVEPSTYRVEPAKVSIRLSVSPKRPVPFSGIWLKLRVKDERPDGTMAPTPGVKGDLQKKLRKSGKWTKARRVFDLDREGFDLANWILEKRRIWFRVKLRPSKYGQHFFGGRYSNVLVVTPRR